MLFDLICDGVVIDVMVVNDSVCDYYNNFSLSWSLLGGGGERGGGEVG